MTGAPKVRAIEILRALERTRRGPYSGVLGYWSVDGSIDLSVLIRTWVVQEGRAVCGVGGGVVHDSRLEDEFRETRVKAEPLLRALDRCAASATR
jgi:anthranilate/para-aminobenzoate synthase component I